MDFCNVVDSIHSELSQFYEKKKSSRSQSKANGAKTAIPWSWVAVSLARMLGDHPTGITKTIVMGELELLWERDFTKYTQGLSAECGTIDEVYDHRCSIPLEAVVKECWKIPGSDIYLVSVADNASYRDLDMYMHVKFNPWISSSCPSLRDGPPFIKDRVIRLICDAKINTPISSQYNNTDIERMNRIARVPPTELLMFCLEPRDAAFVQAEFHDTLRTVRLPNLGGHLAVQRKKIYKLWLKVIHIEKEQHITPSNNDRENRKLKRTDIILVDTTKDNLPAVLSLYDDQIKLATMLSRGDYIGLYHPHCPDAQTQSQMSRSDIIFECSRDTVLFYMSGENARLAGLGKTTPMAFSLSSYTDSQSTLEKHENINNRQPSKPEIMQRDEEGYIDCAMYPNRIYLDDIAPCMLNVTLFGFVKSVASNNPYQSEGKKMDRYAIRIADSTEKMDVTLWAEAGRNARKLHPGHYVLLTGLGTSERSKGSKGPVWYINGSSMYGTEVFNISTTKALLTSSWMRKIDPISALSDGGQWQIDVVVVGWELHTAQGVLLSDQQDHWTSDSYASIADLAVVDAHSVCYRALKADEEGKDVCEFCKCPVPADNVVKAFRNKPIKMTSNGLASSETGWIEWRLDDGGLRTITAYGSEEALLSASAQHFQLMSHEEQIVYLDSVLGKPFLCSVSTTGKGMYRIDQVTPRKPTSQECMEIMKAIKDQEKHILPTTAAT